MDLFEYHAKQALNSDRPLADRMRPERIEDVVGQDHMLGEGSLIRTAILKDRIFSMILWGTAGLRKDNAGKNYRPGNPMPFLTIFRRPVRR